MHAIVKVFKVDASGLLGEDTHRCSLEMRRCFSLFGKSHSSKRWLERQRNDPVVKEARSAGFVSRAALKLHQMDRKLRFLNRSSTVLDLGAAPGGWVQVVLNKPVKQVVAVDLLPPALALGSNERLTWIQGDMTTEATRARIAEAHPSLFSVVLSDAAPSYSGQAQLDHIRLLTLQRFVLEQSRLWLAPKNATLVMKISRGGEEKAFKEDVEKEFTKVALVKPNSSRKESTEIFIVASR